MYLYPSLLTISPKTHRRCWYIYTTQISLPTPPEKNQAKTQIFNHTVLDYCDIFENSCRPELLETGFPASSRSVRACSQPARGFAGWRCFEWRCFPALVERISVILQYFCILAFLLDLCLFDRLTDWGLRQIFYLSVYCYGFLRTFFLSHCLQNTYFHQLFNFSAHNWVKANSYYKYTYRKCKFVWPRMTQYIEPYKYLMTYYCLVSCYLF